MEEVCSETIMFDREIARKVKDLPGTSKRKVLAFIESLEPGRDADKEPNSESGLTFAWEGCLATFTKNKTSVDLQHDSLEWH